MGVSVLDPSRRGESGVQGGGRGPQQQGQRLLCRRGSVGFSEADDWLGREASVLSGDPDGALYRKQAAAKERKPRTWETGRRRLGTAARPPPATSSQGPQSPPSGATTQGSPSVRTWQ